MRRHIAGMALCLLLLLLGLLLVAYFEPCERVRLLAAPCEEADPQYGRS